MNGIANATTPFSKDKSLHIYDRPRIFNPVVLGESIVRDFISPDRASTHTVTKMNYYERCATSVKVFYVTSA